MLPSDNSSAQPGSSTNPLLASAHQSAGSHVDYRLPSPSLTSDLEDAPFWKEVVAYAQFSPSEVEPYHGKFIAVYQGNIVDSDPDEGELALRFYRVFGYVPVYIHAVGVEDEVIDVLG